MSNIHSTAFIVVLNLVFIGNRWSKNYQILRKSHFLLSTLQTLKFWSARTDLIFTMKCTYWPYQGRGVQIMSFVEIEQTWEIGKFLVAYSEQVGASHLDNVDDVVTNFVIFPAIVT